MIGDNIKYLRKKHNMTQTELGQVLGFKGNAIGMYEKGYRTPSIETIKAIADYFNVDISVLLDTKDTPPAEIVTSEERVLLDLFRSASPYQQEIILQLLEAKITPKE